MEVCSKGVGLLTNITHEDGNALRVVVGGKIAAGALLLAKWRLRRKR